MDRTAAIAQLPEAYATALRLADEHLNNEDIAARLNIAIEAVEPLLRIALAKLDGIYISNERSPEPSGHPPTPAGQTQKRTRVCDQT